MSNFLSKRINVSLSNNVRTLQAKQERERLLPKTSQYNNYNQSL